MLGQLFKNHDIAHHTNIYVQISLLNLINIDS